MIGDESEGGDCDEVICEVNQDYSEQNEVDGMKKGGDSTGKVMHMWKSGWWFNSYGLIIINKTYDTQQRDNTDKLF